MNRVNHPRGSLWRKWDLHIHTPASFHWNDGKTLEKMDDSERNKVLDRIIKTMEQLDVAVFGIMDYWTFDGYLGIKERIEKFATTFSKTVFPGMELRIEAPVDFRLNIHVLLSDALSVQKLNDFKSALRIRIGKGDRSLSNESLIEFGKSLDASKAKVHGFSQKDLNDDRKLLLLGSKTAKVTRDSLQNAISELPEGTALIILPYDTSNGLMKLDWKSHPSDDNYFMTSAHIFETRDSKNIDLCLGRETKDNREFIGNFMKSMGGKPKPAISGSDAHKIKDYGVFPSGKVTWIKADPTFQGLMQVINEPEERSFIGPLPSKLEHVINHPTKYIDRLEIKKNLSTTITEKWFDNELDLNPGLISIIGNKGNGKSALVDIVGLLSESKQFAEATFLSSSNFRQPRNNKAKHFTARVFWNGGEPISKGLNDSVDNLKPEQVKYIPQSYLEKVCNQIGGVEESDFDKELKKVIFSHINDADQLGMDSMDDLIKFKTTEALASIKIKKGDIHRINEKIVELEARLAPEYLSELQNNLTAKKSELAAHKNTKPIVVLRPADAPEVKAKMEEIRKKIKLKKVELLAIKKELAIKKNENADNTKLIAVGKNLVQKLDNLSSSIKEFSDSSVSDFKELGLNEQDIFTYVLNKAPITDKLKVLSKTKTLLSTKVELSIPKSLPFQIEKIEKDLEQLNTGLNAPNKAHQEYENALAKWNEIQESIIGSKTKNLSVKFFEFKLNEIKKLPKELKETIARRLDKTKEIYKVINRLGETFRELYGPVNKFIMSNPLAKDKFHLNFDVDLVDSGFEEGFFEMITQGVSGSFCGAEEGRKRINDYLLERNLNDYSDVERFLAEIMGALTFDQRPNGNEVRVKDQLRKGRTKIELYDYVFSLEYLRPRYALRLGEKELHQLSPGERGTLLLLFYLLVDKENKPLILDQPEENLDNQTVFELLVPCIKEAKRRRQILMVTHNPNLAVVCDAEQIIQAKLDKKGNYEMNYLSGSIENPEINAAIVEVLEGTMPAFDNRSSKYQAKGRV